MNKERTLLILWIIFGFVFIQAVDSLLYLAIHLVYFATLSIGMSYSILNFLLPAVTVSFYLLAIVLLLKKFKIDSSVSGILLTEFPKRLFITLLIAGVVLNPITNRLSGLFGEFGPVRLTGSASELLEFYGWMHMWIGVARWGSLIILGLIYLNKYQLRD
ncbi:hypothetical protein O3Q51_05950 [Cryomorphaceae bacterium 1068]|nr:hypothetical protein [Cryomorphaceae bacterium 1068]